MESRSGTHKQKYSQRSARGPSKSETALAAYVTSTSRTANKPDRFRQKVMTALLRRREHRHPQPVSTAGSSAFQSAHPTFEEPHIRKIEMGNNPVRVHCALASELRSSCQGYAGRLRSGSKRVARCALLPQPFLLFS